MNIFKLNVATLFCLFTLVSSTVFGQTNITGSVIDSETSDPLVGAYVLPVGAKGGGVTDESGKFAITLPLGATAFKVNFIGYTEQVTEIGTQRDFPVSLQPEDRLDEVLVIAYGTQKKSDKTGAVAQVTAKELNKGRVTDPIQGLQGKAAGVNVSKQGGDPNSGFSVNIRGAASINGGSGPLYVVDGVVGINPTTLNPEDIASFNVLKDAASTSLYGTQGSNGVIIITTKGSRLKAGNVDPSVKVEYNAFVSFDKVANRLNFLSADQIRQYATDINSQNFSDNGANTDWMDEIYRTGISTQQTIAISQSTVNNSIRASISSNNIEGVIKNSSKERHIGRVNYSQRAFDDKLSINARLSGTVEHNDYINYGGGSSPNNVIYQAMRRSPTDPVRNTDGSFYESDRTFQYNNPVAIIQDVVNYRDAKRLLGNLEIGYNLTEHISASVNTAYARDDDAGYYYEPPTTYSNTTRGLGRRNYNNKNYKYVSEIIKYSNVFKELHSFNAIGGHSWQATQWDGLAAEARNIDPFYSDIGANNLQAFQQLEYGFTSSYRSRVEGIASFFSRGIYDYGKKYYLTASLRRDKSTKYGANYEWGTFWALSGAWNVSKEDFMNSLDIFSDLKLRLGYGTTGNADIASGIDIPVYGPNGLGTNPETGLKEVLFNNSGQNIANPDLRWEKVGEFNIGLDFGLYKNKIYGSLEYYRKSTTDLVMEVSVPVPPNIAPKKFENLGEIQNNGIEATINVHAIDRKNLKWKTTITAARNKQETISLGDLASNELGIKKLYVSGRGLVGGDNYTQLIKPGHEIGSFFLPVFVQYSTDGKFLFESETGGVTRDINKAKRQFVGSAQPDVIIGWSNYFEIWKGLDASFSLRGIFGHQIFNVTRMVFSNPGDAPNLNVLEFALDESALTSDPTISDYYLEDGDFVKLDNISLGYNIATPKNKRIDNLRVYLNSNNLWMWTKYSGLDPEINFSGTEFGRDQYDVYPRTRSITFGINIALK
ncbi:SusC/RagA family TonB-linked outer membrane protein [Bacteroidia bacterium]|nr:SusC/RagA family TonB-linked outer membrane protein [Bacteroidia bacterium]MDB4107601.1 SusC/RagA family TonB-linked outer membrane protein [Bacteroidia bacterium]MDB9883134.1 SusC/RagA family TonB-linked outer membrane protein [Bacteroidia bacterium]